MASEFCGCDRGAPVTERWKKRLQPSDCATYPTSHKFIA
jgi:hypothetical protein